jgi:3-hydroxyacyl-[acyl-carrier-protein] dehydratase
MRFHLIDRVDAWEPFRSVRARKLTSHSEEYWEPSADGPIMPPPLVLEALCQAGTWLVMLSTDVRKRAALLSVGSVDFLGDVRPGDVLELQGSVDSMGDEVAVVSGQVVVGGRSVLEAKDIMCVLIDAGDLEDVEDTRRMLKLLTRTGAA